MSEILECFKNEAKSRRKSADDKFYFTEVADTEQLIRLIHSIPSPKAELFCQN